MSSYHDWMRLVSGGLVEPEVADIYNHQIRNTYNSHRDSDVDGLVSMALAASSAVSLKRLADAARTSAVQ